MARTLQVREIYNTIDEFAPFNTAEEWDNVGLLVGDFSDNVTGVVTCLDVTEALIEKAIAQSANLIVCHHPVIFKPIYKLSTTSIPHLLASRGIACIAAHTNFDVAESGINDLIAQRLALLNVRSDDDGVCRLGELESEMTASQFISYVKELFDVPDGGIHFSGSGRAKVRTISLCGGSGGDYVRGSLEKSDVYLTGEMSYHDFDGCRDLTTNQGKVIICAGHYHTEILVGNKFCDIILRKFPEASVNFIDSGCSYNIL